MIHANERKNNEIEEELAYRESLYSAEITEQERALESRNERFTLWLASIFLPWMIRFCAASFAILLVVQLTIRFPWTLKYIIAAAFTAISAGAVLVSKSRRIIDHHRRRRRK
jgi:type IV secretory pathway component VirB8